MIRRMFPWLTAALGLLIAVAAILHMVGVTRIAYSRRSGYDARLAQLLWIGWTSLVLGALMVACSRAIQRGSQVARHVASGAAAVLLVCLALLAPVAAGFWVGIPLFAGYLLLAAWKMRDAARRSS